MYDYFVAALRCPSCGRQTPADSSTNMQTHLRDDARGEELGLGSAIEPADLRPADILNSGYQLIREPIAGEPLRLLEMWTDPACGRGDLWALVTIDGTRLASIVAVSLNQATLASAHYISDNCVVVATAISGVPAADLVSGKVHCVDVLRMHLPEKGASG